MKIDQIIAAAKRVGTFYERREDIAASLTLMNCRIAMAEALAKIASNERTADDMAAIARECLDKIVKETNHD